MIGLVRATLVCATLALGLVSAQAADKAFKRDDLADSAIKLEAQIKSEAGPVAKSTATLRTDADTAFKRADFRTGLQILGQIAATTPEDSGNWLRLAKTIFQIRSASSSEQTFLLERASTAAYIAYQRAGNPAEEADALAVLGRALSDRKLWRPSLDALRLSLDMREVAEVRGQYEKMRDEHGFRLWTTPSIPTGRRHGPASSSRKTSPSGSTLRRSWRWPAPTSRRCRPKASSFASTA